MVFWNRLRPSKLKFHAFSNEFKRFYNLTHGPIVANQVISTRTLVPILNYPKFIVEDGQLEFFRKVRFYGARVKSAPKKEKRDTDGPRLNEEITAPTVRLVTDEGHCVISRYEALTRAESLEMDLVEVDRQANPPVCKIFDYNKLKYIQQTREKERSKNKSALKTGPCKEVRFAGKIKRNDLKIKADMVKRLMESGYRVKCTATDPADDVDLKSLLSQFTALIEDVAVMESEPKYEKKQAFVVVRHIKFGPSKKGLGKKASVAAVSSRSSENQPLGETGEAVEVYSGSEHVGSEESSDEDVQTTKSDWAVFNRDDDIHSIFNINNEEYGQLKSSKHEQSASVAGLPPYSMDRKPRHAVEPPPTNTASSIPFGIPKPAMENRYARDPRSAKPPRIPADIHPAHEVSRQDSSRSSNPNSPAKSFGIFSTPQANAAPSEQNATAASNRYKKNVPSDSARSPRTTGASPQRDYPTADSRMKRGAGGNPVQGRYGIFSGDTSSSIPNKN